MIKTITLSLLVALISWPSFAADDYTKELYELYCQSCHGVKGSGAPQAFNPKSWKPVLKKGMEKTVNSAIAGTGNMPAMGTCSECGTTELENLIHYMSNKEK